MRTDTPLTYPILIIAYILPVIHLIVAFRVMKRRGKRLTSWYVAATIFIYWMIAGGLGIADELIWPNTVEDAQPRQASAPNSSPGAAGTEVTAAGRNRPKAH